VSVATPSDESLLAQFLQGKRDPFEVLVKRYELPLLNFIYRYTQDREESEDIFQETFVRVAKRAKTFNPEMTFKTWLYTIALNLCRTRAKKRLSMPFLASEHIGADEDDRVSLESSAAPESLPETLLSDRELAGKIAEAVNSLSPKHREVFILYQYQNFSYEDIAHLLGRPLGTIKSQMHYAVAYLKDKLKDLISSSEVQNNEEA
jgi:RNA polymerase sigma-70 factor (ECF subfamily)